MKYKISIAFCLLFIGVTSANEIKISNTTEIIEAISKVRMGDRIIIPNGISKDTGTNFNPIEVSSDSIFLKGETDGKGVVFKNNTINSLNSKETGGLFILKRDLRIGFSVSSKILLNKISSYNPKGKKVTTIEEIIKVEPGIGNLEKAIKKVKGPAKLVLTPGIYLLDRSVSITGNITIQGEDEASKTIISFNPDAERISNYLFRVEPGATFSLENATLSAKETQDVKYAILSPKENNPGANSIFIDKCIISDFTNTQGASVFKAFKGTFADTIKISNSVLKNNFRGINLSYEKENNGKYNAENVILENTVFMDFTQWVLHYYRGGNDESTLGGNLVIDHCVFSKIGTAEKDLVLQNKGIINIKISNSVFFDNHDVKTLLRLNGKNNSINNSVVYNSGEIKLSGSAFSTNIINKNPSYHDIQNFIPKDKSPLKSAGTDKKDIGILLVK